MIFKLSNWFKKSKTKKQKLNDVLKRKPLNNIETSPDSPVPFGYKIAWLAIQSENINSVLEVLQLAEMQSANWASGIVAAYNKYTFVSPPVQGWIFIVSSRLPELDLPDSSKSWEKMMSTLSKNFSNLQYYASHRVVEYHSWAMFKNGNEIRAFAYIGDGGITAADRGKKTPEEIELKQHFFDERSPEASEDSYWEREDLKYPDEEDVMNLAGKWSLNPQRLDEYKNEIGTGYVGVLNSGFYGN